MDGEELVGQLARVVTRIRGEQGPDEISLSVGVSTQVLIAYADAEIAANKQVIITGWRGGRTVDVTAGA